MSIPYRTWSSSRIRWSARPASSASGAHAAAVAYIWPMRWASGTVPASRPLNLVQLAQGELLLAVEPFGQPRGACGPVEQLSPQLLLSGSGDIGNHVSLPP